MTRPNMRASLAPLALALPVSLAVPVSLALVLPAEAQTAREIIDALDPDGGLPSASGTILRTFGIVTLLSFVPLFLVAATSFTRFAIAFSLLRMGMGLQTTPANLVLIALSVFMTFYVMSPTFERAWADGIQPLAEERIDEVEALRRAARPFHDFMLANTRDEDLDLFVDLAREADRDPGTPEAVSMSVLAPAFLISEIRRGFEIGFLIVLPFLVIDLVVATITMSMGMMMLPPTVVSLPFKVLFFVLMDGWNLLVGAMVRSVAG